MDDNDSENAASITGLIEEALLDAFASDSSDNESNDSELAEDFIIGMGNAALVTPDETSINPARLTDESNDGEPVEGVPAESFNLDLPPEHLYLGDNLEAVPGRIILSEGSYMTIPLLPRSYGTLIPGQTFPLTVRDYARTNMLRKCVETDHTFGCIATRYARRYHGSGRSEELIGTTAEIYEYSDDMGTICIKAKARQRFRVIKTKRAESGYFIGEVQILPEITLPKALSEIQFASLNKYRTSQKDKCRKLDAQLTAWPSWVYDQYDTDKLAERVDRELPFLKQGLRQISGKIIMPKDPSELSFWIATHLDADERLFVIRLNCPIQRLRWQLSLMNKCQMYSCHVCQTQIAHQSDVFAMSVEGAQNTYVNPHGFLHETITLRSTMNLSIVSTPSTEYSWFPGYAWSIAVCATCHTHIGWQFTAQQHRMRPSKFWGLSRQSLITKLSMDGHQESDIPVM